MNIKYVKEIQDSTCSQDMADVHVKYAKFYWIEKVSKCHEMRFFPISVSSDLFSSGVVSYFAWNGWMNFTRV